MCSPSTVSCPGVMITTAEIPRNAANQLSKDSSLAGGCGAPQGGRSAREGLANEDLEDL
jgi:hypothetical protein